MSMSSESSTVRIRRELKCTNGKTPLRTGNCMLEQ